MTKAQATSVKWFCIDCGLWGVGWMDRRAEAVRPLRCWAVLSVVHLRATTTHRRNVRND